MRLRVIAVGIGFRLVAATLVGAPAGARPPEPIPPPTRAEVVDALRRADTYWIANGPDQAPNNWQNATFNVGNLAYVTVFGKTNGYTLPWSRKNQFALRRDPARPFFPNDLAAGEAYLDLYRFHAQPAVLADLRARVTEHTATVQSGQAGEWDYADALNMAMPSFARLAVMDSRPEYLTAMHQLFRYTKDSAGGCGLYSEWLGLWRRDAASYAYWSRSNGWAIAALVKVLKVLPADDPRRPEYARIVTRMASTLRHLQRRDGFWNVDLLNPFDHPGPETTGTALLTYALAGAINQGILPENVYRPVVERAWRGMAGTALRADGFLGYVQGPATRPWDSQPVSASDTAAYGVGAFLLAGSQVAALET